MKHCKDCGFVGSDIRFEHEREVFENETDFRYYCPKCESENIGEAVVAKITEDKSREEI